MSYPQQQFSERLGIYLSQNLSFSLYYDKMYKKEYLPSRVRYNQFFFFATLTAFSSYFLFKPMFAVNSNKSSISGQRYYTSDRSFVNMFARSMNKSSAKSQVAK